MGKAPLNIEDPVIEVENLVKAYKKGPLAVQGVSFSVGKGEVFGLIGPDGAGKTSIIQILAGVLSASGGRVLVAGTNPISDPEGVKEIIGYMPQGIGLNLYDSLSVQENIEYFRDLRSVPAGIFQQNRDELLAMTRLGPFIGRQARHLSGGMRQKLALICTLIHLPDVILLDEPTTGVDPLSRRDFWQIMHRLVQQRQVTVLLSTSYMDEAERCHRVALMHEGRVIDHGTPDHIRSKLTGRFLKVMARPQQKAVRALKSWSETLSSEVFGKEIRLRLKAEKEALLSYLSEKAIEVDHIAPYEAGLEDVFIQLITKKSGQNDIALPLTEDADPSEEIVIKCDSVTRLFDSFLAVDSVNLRVTRGEVCGLLGPNGAGKTTLIKMMCGLLEPSEGSVEVAGFDVLAQRRQVWGNVGYMSQRFALYRDLTVFENMKLYASLYGVHGKDFKKVMEPLGLSDFKDRLARDLPLGVRQRLSLACALLHEPPVLFLDEPTSGVDPVARRAFWDIIYSLSRESGVTVIVSTHYMDEAEHCDRLGLMHQGRLITIDTPGNLKGSSEKRSGSLIAVRTSNFRQAFDLITSTFPRATLYGSRIHLRTPDPESDKIRAVNLLKNAGLPDVEVTQEPLSMEETFVDHIEAAEEAHV